MRVLFDQGTPAPLRHVLTAHQVQTAYELGWATLTNGQLLAAAEASGFDVLVTTDRQLKYQQNLASRRIAIVVLGSTSWPRIRESAAVVVDAVHAALAGSYVEVIMPPKRS